MFITNYKKRYTLLFIDNIHIKKLITYFLSLSKSHGNKILYILKKIYYLFIVIINN